MNQLPESAEDLVPDVVPVDEPSVVVEPDQAPAVYEEAVRVMNGEPSPEEFEQAKDDLHAACRADFAPACAFLREKLESPRRISGKPPEYTNEAIQKRTFATVVLRCKLGTDGRMRDCKVLESAPHGLTESVLAYAARAVYQPVRLAGHPFEVSYTFRFNFRPFRIDLTPAQETQWARARTERFPQSSPAWMTLANLLARHAPDDPWLRVQAGRHAEAAPLAKRAVSREPSNPYVLETSAAVLAASGQCEQALHEQRQAVAKLPAEWPAEERARFTRTLEQYQRQCAAQPPPG
ncbi:MAG TPA: TonB family protein [Myxococcus sp.]|nr:TonB family protein [Myxococcus sp.]